MGFGYAVDIDGNPYTYYGGWIETGTAAGDYYSGVFTQLSDADNFGSISSNSAVGFGSLSQGIIGIVSTGTTSYGYSNYIAYSTTSDVPATGNYYIAIGDGNADGLKVQWLRIRNYPPNGVMPSVTFGSVQSTVAITLYLNGVSNANVTISVIRSMMKLITVICPNLFILCPLEGNKTAMMGSINESNFGTLFMLFVLRIGYIKLYENDR